MGLGPQEPWADVPTSFRYRSPQLHSPCWGLAQGHGPPVGGYSRERLAGVLLPGVPSVILPDGPLHSRGSTTSTLEVLGVTYYQSILVICTDFTDFSDS